MASTWIGNFRVVEEAKRLNDNLVKLRCVDPDPRDGDDTFFDAMGYGKTGELLEKIKTGETVFLSGRPQFKVYKGNISGTMWVSSMEFVGGGKSDGKAKKSSKPKAEKAAPQTDVDDVELGDEDIPF